MEDEMQAAFLVLIILFPSLICLLYCVVNYYMRRKGSLESRRHDLRAAQTRLQLQELREQIARRQEANDPLRISLITKALNFETIRLPASGKRLKDQDDEEDTEDGTTVHDSCHEDDVIDIDVEQNSPPSFSCQNRRPSSSSSTTKGGLKSNAFTSILEMLVQPWTAEEEDNDLDVCCCICLDPYQSGEVICSPKFPDCDHIFHETCAMQWFKKSDECPLCRTNIISSLPE